MISKHKQPTFFLDTIPIKGNVILAPMDGLSDSPYRRIARAFGSAMSYSEFINAQEVLTNFSNQSDQMRFTEQERPLIYQLYDDNPDRILLAAEKLLKNQPDAIDINMGCSVKRVSSRGAGAGLLQTPDKVARIITTLKARLPIPISAKIRLGWDDTQKNYLEIGKIIEDSGASLIAVHGRTKDQAYQGEADWEAIAELKRNLSIPVIGNGDIKKAEDIEKMLLYTSCDAVMIGRAAIGNPWLFRKTNKIEIKPEKIKNIILEHLNLSIKFYGPEDGLIKFRKHAKKYLDHLTISKEVLVELLTCRTFDNFRVNLNHIFALLE